MLPDFSDVLAAAERIAPMVKTTPVLTSSYFDERSGAQLFFKAENFQRMGAFKFRGACNAVFSEDVDALKGGVVTHSSGNHGQALALAAKMRGIPAHIVMPENASAVKVAAVRGYGATVHFCAPTQAAREQTTERILSETGASLIHPYDDDRIIAGQGTAALELLRSHPELDVVMAPVGGGGLISGTALAAHGLRSDIRVIGAEPAGADDAWRSLKAGEIIPVPHPDTVADGLRATIGKRNFSLIRDHLEQILTVVDRDIIEAMRLVWERMKIVIEPSSAVPVAAVLKYPEVFARQRVGIILSGGNVDLAKLPWQ